MLCTWYLHNWIDDRLQRSEMKRIFHIASALGDSELATMGLQLMYRYDYDLDYSDYICLIRACTVGEDFAGVIEMLFEAEKSNIDIYTDATTGYSLQERLSKSLNSLYRLDEMYYALTDLLSRKIPVPAVVLNAIIMGSGRRGNLDRAFATFQESQGMFQIQPDIFSYNALLYATSRARNPSVINLLSVYEEMEKNNVYPNHISFSILFELMGEVGDMTGFDEIKTHMMSSGIYPTQHSIRRVLTKLAKQGEFEKVGKLIQEFYPDEEMDGWNIEGTNSEGYIPNDAETDGINRPRTMTRFLKRRLEVLRSNAENLGSSVHTNEEENKDKTAELVDQKA